MCKVYHAVARQEILAGAKDRGFLYNTGNSFKSMDMISLDIMGIFFSCGHRAYGMALKYTCNRVCAQNS
jgi:hypothetical protein